MSLRAPGATESHAVSCPADLPGRRLVALDASPKIALDAVNPSNKTREVVGDRAFLWVNLLAFAGVLACERVRAHTSSPSEGGSAGEAGSTATADGGASAAGTGGSSGAFVEMEDGDHCSDGVLVFCDNRCVDLETDAAHCGSCANACDGGTSCEGGACVCVGSSACSGECVDTDSDPEHCGGCDDTCDQDQVCSRGTCGTSCEQGETSCDRSCVDTQTNAAHCGGCSSACPTGAGCVAGECRCPGSDVVCDGQCVDTMTNTSHCGDCDSVCTGDQTCSGGTCRSAEQTNGGGGSTSSGGSTSTQTGGNGGATTESTNSGGAGVGGSPTTGGTGGTGGTGSVEPPDGPCDIYEAGGTPCVAAYSMVRLLSSTYTGPLYQVRRNSSTMNTGSGGQVYDIPATAEGVGDAAAQDTACGSTICTISILYDQSGNGNHLRVAKAGSPNGGEFSDEDDFESIADAGPLKVGGRDVYSLYTEARQGYRSPVGEVMDRIPLDQEPQGIYMLADGTHYGTACCFDFGNVSPDPTRYGVMNTLFFGIAYWGRGAGNGPWFMADFEAGVWAGGSNPGDPGWGGLADSGPPNPNNPTLTVPFALGFLKTNATDWSLRMADAATASTLTTAYAGALPKAMDNQGGIVLGVGGDNSNNSWGTFYEGAIVAGYPSNSTELAVLENIQAVGYGN